MYFVYILKLSNSNFYAGFTNDIKRRIAEHKQGKIKSTRKFLPCKFIHCEIYLNKKDAQRREKYYKTSKGKITLKLMLREYLK